MTMTHPTHRPSRRAALLPLVAAVAAAAVGCGPATTDVSGTVKYQSKPLPVGTVTLVDSSGAVHQADIGRDGNYSLPNVPVGTVRIAVVVPKPAANKPAPFGGKPPELPVPAAQVPEVPIEYANPDTSGLTGTVTPGKPLDIDIPK